MPTALPLTTRIDQSSARERTYRTLTAKFGNGYGQSIPDGINNVVDTWSVSYSDLTQTERDLVMVALDAVRGWDYLTWQAPGDASSKKWKLVSSVKEKTTGHLFNVSFTLEQTF